LLVFDELIKRLKRKMIDQINLVFLNFIEFSSTTLANYWQNFALLNFSLPQIFIDIFLVSIVFYSLFVLLKGSRAYHILLGLLMVGVIFLLSKFFNLIATGWLLDRFFTVTLIAIPVIFQQELRMALEKLGKTKIFPMSSPEEVEMTVQNVLAAIDSLQRAKCGALLVLKNEVSLSEYADTGVEMNANISKELIESIFIKKSPLHDGAMILDNNKIKAAGCILPPSFKNYGHDFGTRHKAAIGLSEATDAHVIVLSEERSTLSYAKDGKIEQNIDTERLEKLMKNFYKKAKKT
jgi:diadenylate cyclase